MNEHQEICPRCFAEYLKEYDSHRACCNHCGLILDKELHQSLDDPPEYHPPARVCSRSQQQELRDIDTAPVQRSIPNHRHYDNIYMAHWCHGEFDC